MSGKAAGARLLFKAAVYARWLNIVLIGLGIVGTLLLPLAERKNFFDENALLVDGAHSGVKPSMAKDNKHVTQSRHILTSLSKGTHPANLLPTLTTRPLSVQTFHPKTSPHNCSNIHTIVPSPRGDGSESMLLVTPVSIGCDESSSECLHQTLEGAAAALVVGLGLSEYLGQVHWLAKDFVWLISDARCGVVESAAAWIEQYQGDSRHSGTPFARAGTLQQAVVVELQDATWEGLEVTGQGFDGQLPKLDLFMLAEHHFRKATRLLPRLPGSQGFVMPHGSLLAKHVGPLMTNFDATQRDYLDSLFRLTAFTRRQLHGLPTGGHASFKAYFVDAVTVRSKQRDDFTPERPHLTLEAAAALELIFRSCNALAERLHHSYFLYLQPSTRTFITIDMYIIPTALLLLSLILWASNIILLPHTANKHQAPDHTPGTTTTAEAGDVSSLWRDGNGLAIDMMNVATGLVAVMAVHCVCCAVGVIDMVGGGGMHDVALDNPSVALACACFACCVAGGAVAISPAISREVALLVTPVWRSIKVATLMLTVVLMLGWSCINWATVHVSLLFLTLPLLLAAPLRCAQVPLPSRILFLCTLLLSSPFSINTLLQLDGTGVLLQPELWLDALKKSDYGIPWMQELQRQSSVLTCAYFWIVYKPAWLICGIIAAWPS